MPNNQPQAHHSWDEQERRAQGIQHFQKRLQTSNGFVRSDSDPNIFTEKLTYKRVMKRIVKRYIFDVQRENDANDGDFDEIKQDISSFRYEMLNHISVRQLETMENKDRLDRLFGKLDNVLMQQKQLLRAVASGAHTSDDSVVTSTSSNSTNKESVCSSSSNAFSNADDDEDAFMASVSRFAKTKSSVKSMKQIPEESYVTKSEVDDIRISPTKKDGNLKRQEGMGSSAEDDAFSEGVEVRDVRVCIMTSPNHKAKKDDHL